MTSGKMTDAVVSRGMPQQPGTTISASAAAARTACAGSATASRSAGRMSAMKRCTPTSAA
jgi:hypothetical protein